MHKIAVGMVWLLSALMVVWHWSLAVRVDYGLRLLAVLEGLAALLLIVAVIARLSRRKSVTPLIPLTLALLSSSYYVSNYPYYVNRLVERVGPALLVKETTALCAQFSAIPEEEREKQGWKRLYRSDPRFPPSLKQLHPAYATVTESGVDLKMGGWLDEYQGIEIQAEATPGEVDWSQTWNVRESHEDGVAKTRRVIAPGIEWHTWSAP